MTKKEYSDKLFAAISADDKNTFENLINSDTGDKKTAISLGRFPLLSLIYLCKAKRIAAIYEKTLADIRDYEIYPEPVDAYLLFKRLSKRALRLYLSDGTILKPIEALAVLGDRDKVLSMIKKSHIDELTLKKVAKIYRLTHSLNVVATPDGLIIPRLPLELSQWLMLSAMVVVAILGIVISIVSSENLFASFGGDGGQGNPMFIASGEKLTAALNGDNKSAEMVFTSDVVVSDLKTVSAFSGIIDGAGHTLTIEGDYAGAIFNEFSGTLKNLNLSVQSCKAELFDDLALIAVVNKGTIENVNLTVTATLSENIIDPDPDDKDYPDVYYGFFAAWNEGTIKNCGVDCKVEFVGNGSGNMYFACFAGVNEGQVLNCTTLENSSVNSNTTDIGGIVAENMSEGIISNCTNRAQLTQVSTVNTWLPNVGGIACTNEGLIENCVNYGVLHSKSTAMQKEGDNLLEVYVGGIVCSNKAKVKRCLNKADLYVESGIFSVYAGGVVCNNTYVTDETNTPTVGAEVIDCGSSGKIYARTEKTTITSNSDNEEEQTEVENPDYKMQIGGIAAYCVWSSVVNCYSLMTYDVPQGRMVGGIIGAAYVSNLTVYVKSIENCAYLAANDNVLAAFRFGDALLESLGYPGTDENCAKFTSAEKLKESEVYWE